MKDVYIDPCNDFFTRYLLGSEKNNKLLLSFINAVLSDSDIETVTEVSIKNPFNLKTDIFAKETILDVKAKDAKDRLYDIEIQSYPEKSFALRSLYLWSRQYSGQLKTAKQYYSLKPVININILKPTLFRELPDFHNFFVIKENKQNFVMTDHLQLHFLELEKLKEIDAENSLQRWLYFFKNEGGDNPMLKTLINSDEILEQAHKEYTDFTQDEQARDAALSREMWLHDYYSGMASAKEEGKAEKEREMNIQHAKKMKEKGAEISFIMDITGLSEEEIRKL